MQRDSSHGVIVVAMDFSTTAHHALRWAAAKARQCNKRIVLVHVIEADRNRVPLTIQEDMVRALREIEKSYKDEVAIGSMVRAGTPWQEVIAAAESLGASWIVAGVRGQTDFTRLVIGSTVDRIVRASHVPVIAVHPEDEAPPQTIATVIVGVDFSEESSLAISAAVRVLRQCAEGGRLVLVHACHTPIAYEPYAMNVAVADLVAESEAEARRQLERLAAPLCSESFKVEVQAREGYPASVVCQVAEENGAELIFVGTHGRTGAGRLFLGSVAERVLHHAKCPVVTIHQPAATEPMQLSA